MDLYNKNIIKVTYFQDCYFYEDIPRGESYIDKIIN